MNKYLLGLGISLLATSSIAGAQRNGLSEAERDAVAKSVFGNEDLLSRVTAGSLSITARQVAAYLKGELSSERAFSPQARARKMDLLLLKNHEKFEKSHGPFVNVTSHDWLNDKAGILLLNYEKATLVFGIAWDDKITKIVMIHAKRR